MICVVNKSDLPLTLDVQALSERFSHLCVVSARDSRGLEDLEAQVAALFPQPGQAGQGELLTNARQMEAVGRALEGVERAGEEMCIRDRGTSSSPPRAVMICWAVMGS